MNAILIVVMGGGVLLFTIISFYVLLFRILDLIKLEMEEGVLP